MILVYPVGIPLMYLWLLYQVKDEIKNAINNIDNNVDNDKNNNLDTKSIDTYQNLLINDNNRVGMNIKTRNNSINKSYFDIPYVDDTTNNESDNNIKKPELLKDELKGSFTSGTSIRSFTNRKYSDTDTNIKFDQSNDNIELSLSNGNNNNENNNINNNNINDKINKENGNGTDADIASPTEIVNRTKSNYNNMMMIGKTKKSNYNLNKPLQLNQKQITSINTSNNTLNKSSYAKFILSDNNNNNDDENDRQHIHIHRDDDEDYSNNDDDIGNLGNENNPTNISEFSTNQRIIFTTFEVKILRFLWEPYIEKYW